MAEFKFSDQVKGNYPIWVKDEPPKQVFNLLESADPVFQTIYESTTGYVSNLMDVNTCQTRYMPVIADSLGVDAFIDFNVDEYYTDGTLSHIVTGFYDYFSQIDPNIIPSGTTLYEVTVTGGNGDGVYTQYVRELQADAASVSGDYDAYILTPYYQLLNILSAPSGWDDDTLLYVSDELYNNTAYLKHEREFLRESLRKLNTKGINQSLRATFQDYILRAFSSEYKKNLFYSSIGDNVNNNFNLEVRELIDPWNYYTEWSDVVLDTQTFPMTGMMNNYRDIDTQGPMTSAFAVTLINMFPDKILLPDGGLAPAIFNGVEFNDVIRGLYYTSEGYFNYKRGSTKQSSFDTVGINAPGGIITYAEAINQGVSGIIPSWSDYISNDRGIAATMRNPNDHYSFEDVYEYFTGRGKGEWQYIEHSALRRLEYEKGVNMWLPYRTLEESMGENIYCPTSGNGDWDLPAISGYKTNHVKKSESDKFGNVYTLLVPSGAYGENSNLETISSASSGTMLTHYLQNVEYTPWEVIDLPIPAGKSGILGEMDDFYLFDNIMMAVTNEQQVAFYKIDGPGQLNDRLVYYHSELETYVGHLFDEVSNRVYILVKNGTTYKVYEYSIEFNVLIPAEEYTITDDVRYIAMILTPNGNVGFAGVKYSGGVPVSFVKYILGADFSGTNTITPDAIDGFIEGQTGVTFGDDYMFTFISDADGGYPFNRALMIKNVIAERELITADYLLPFDFRYKFHKDIRDGKIWTTFNDNKFTFNSVTTRDNIMVATTPPISSVFMYNPSGDVEAVVSNHILDGDTRNFHTSGSSVTGGWFNYFMMANSQDITFNDPDPISGGFIDVTITKARNVMNVNHEVVKVGITHTPTRYFGADLFDTVFLYEYDYDNNLPNVEYINKWFFYSRNDVKTGLFDIYINNFRFSDNLSDEEVATIKIHIERVIRDAVRLVKPVTSELRYVVWNNSNR